ncbi:MAG TPA: hypothetical protein VM925_32860 [Labilithrix sp.]|nr:hypothetical protein [Labilithrix sp.]
MRWNPTLSSLALGAAVLAACIGACKKSPETEQREAAEAELRSAEAPATPPKPLVDEKNAYLAVVRREQLELRAHLQEDIDDIDKKLAELKVDARDGGFLVDPTSKNAVRIRALLERRSQLEQDAATVERADERGWDELKATIEKDLARNRPRGRI